MTDRTDRHRSTARKPSTRDEQRRATRRRLYEHALEVFRRDGVGACRIDDIAKAAGVSRGAFYFHFPTKEHVLLERMRETEDVICEAIDALPPDAPTDRVLATVNEQLTAIWQDDPDLLPDLASAALHYTATTMSDQEATPLRALLGHRFRAGVERGDVTSHLPADVLSDLYLGHTLAGLLAWYGNRGIPLRQVLDAVTMIFWNGAKAS